MCVLLHSVSAVEVCMLLQCECSGSVYVVAVWVQWKCVCCCSVSAVEVCMLLQCECSGSVYVVAV